VFLLSRSHLPEQPSALATALDQGLRVFVSRSEPMVTVRGSDVSTLDEIAIDLSGGRIESLRRLPRPVVGVTKPAILTGEFSIKAKPLSIWDGEITFEMTARNLELAQAKQADKKLMLVVHRAERGSVRIEAGRGELEKLVARAAGKLAHKQGVTIENVNLSLAQPQPRVIEVKVTVAARKLLFRPVLILSGRIAISEELVATISNLSCSGGGAIAALACAAITPQFRRIERRGFPLSALPLGEVQLRDVAVDLADDRVTIAANFGERSVPA
jgi:hypothetical protein